METILITGGTGMIGKELTQALLQRGFAVIVLTRNPSRENKDIKNLSFSSWDPAKNMVDKDAITKADHIIHLAGTSVAEKRWTAKRKKEIVSSRVQSGKLIVENLRTIPNKVKTIISISGIGWYGADPEIPNRQAFSEKDPPDESFLGQTCKEWEAAIDPAFLLGKRLVKFRTGIVLSNDGGALLEFKKPLRFGLAAVLGSGKQIISWIHIDDLVRLFMYALETESLSGVYNAVAPMPVSNKTFVMMLAKRMNPSFFIPIHVPSFVLQVILGEMSIEVLKSATVSAQKVLEAGFIFQYPGIDAALQQLTDS